MVPLFKKYLRHPLVLLGTFVLILIITWFGPTEKTLGANLKLVLLHGAWVWVGKIAFAVSAIFAVFYLVSYFRGKKMLPQWLLATRASAYTALFFWLTYLPMSLLVMQLNWGGFFFDEPRWKIPFLFGIIALLVQAAFFLFEQPLITSLGNLIYGVALWWTLGISDNVLHPDSPVSQSNSGNIQLYFVFLMGFTLLFGIQIGWWLFHKLQQKRPAAV